MGEAWLGCVHILVGKCSTGGVGTVRTRGRKGAFYYACMAPVCARKGKEKYTINKCP